jgi:L-aminopeptidase/D-esterase-like protein
MQGFARALSPPHLDTDADTLFCLSVGDARSEPDALAGARGRSRRSGIVNAARAATSLPGVPAARDL